MKKLLLFSALFISFLTFAQVPQGISYQAIALNSSGAPVVSSDVRVKLSILDSSSSGTILYTETQLKTTNAQGLFNLVIGQGTLVSGAFNTINWGNNSKFLKVEMDASGGTNYALVGTTQLLSVPYAMHAASVSSIAGNTNINDEIIENKTSNIGFIDLYDNKVYVYTSTVGTWSSQSFNANASPQLIESNGNFAFVDFYDNKAYSCNGKTGIWSSQTFNPNASPDLVTSNNNFAFIDFYDNKAYVYNTKTGIWASQTFNSNASPDLMESNGNFAFLDLYDNKAYVFSTKTGTWLSQTFNGNASPILTATNGNFAFLDLYDNKAYIFNGKIGTWSSQTFNSNASPTLITSGTN
ncbi:hypothetical protein EZL74_06255 [Flavobacterium silvisoli]|uniref:Bulb-type lectin domain-containing protein n=1 Tax=Flavobacterium silvisoli TaxID=2529433 RepID=A0A4Q9Z1M5_9FLAO|nr:hypothetical protein [Flavobacterium silvisoli]TBX70016.1 hypothetical protein EZL74_06255 [Flavobacterium silvisoli]